jgi:Fe-S-cluster containining protein
MNSPIFQARFSDVKPLNCDGCTRCCRGDLIVLHPEHGDDPAKYETFELINPVTGARCLAIKRGADPDRCRYLGESGCTIYADRPAICREFDCSKAFLRFTRNERRAAVKAGVATMDVFEMGRRKAKERGMLP